jgi:hypothetical protein
MSLFLYLSRLSRKQNVFSKPTVISRKLYFYACTSTLILIHDERAFTLIYKSNTTGPSNGAGTDYSSGVHEFTPGF